MAAVHQWPMLFLLVMLFHSCYSHLARDQKQLLLDLHNDARRFQGIPDMKLMVWDSSLGATAESSASGCTTSPTPQRILLKAVAGAFSWVGQNQYILSGAAITNSSIRKTFGCWFSGNSTCSWSQKAQVLNPQSYLFGCGARLFTNSDRCHSITSGVKFVCFYAPGYISKTNIINRNQCPPDAKYIVNGLCSNTTNPPVVPIDPVDPPSPTQSIVYWATPCYGSFGGGTLLTIHGRGFAADQFNDKDPSLGNKVVFYDNSRKFPCSVIPYYSSTEKIVCRTNPYPVAGNFKLQVFVDGKLVQRISACTFKYRWWATPTITDVSPPAGVSPMIVSLYGKIFTYKVSDSQDTDDASSDQMIERLSVGGELCDPWNETSPYGGSMGVYGFGSVSCQPVSTRIASMNATIVLSEFGNSIVPVEKYSIDNRLRRYLFQTHSDVTGVEPNFGSPSGGTHITIYGRNFYPNSPLDVQASISGIPCRVINYTSNAIECITGKAPTDSMLYEGSRGLLREVWLNGYTRDLDTIEKRPIGCYMNLSNCSIEEIALLSQENAPKYGERVRFNQRLIAFFIPPLDSKYSFSVNADDSARLYISPNASSEAKKLVAFVKAYSRNWNTFPSQISEPIYLKAGKSYYIEALHEQGGGNWKIGFGAKVHNLSWNSDIGVVDYEEQEILINSTIVKETQLIKFIIKPAIQLFQFNTTGEWFTYLLSFNGSLTQELSSDDNATTIEQSLNDLETITKIGKVSVRLNVTNDSMKVVIIIVSGFKNLPLIEVHNYTNASTRLLQKAWFPPTSFYLSFFNNSRMTRPFSVNTTTRNLSVELMSIFTTACDISGPMDVFFNDTYDVRGTTRYSFNGVLDSRKEPYCGRYSIRNPFIIWRKGYTRDERTNTALGNLILSRFGRKYVCFAYSGPVPYSRFKVAILISSKQVHYNIPLTSSAHINNCSIGGEWECQCTDLYQTLNELVEPPLRVYYVTQIYFDKTSTDFWIDEFFISSTKPKMMKQTKLAVRPNGIFVKSVDVTKVTQDWPSLYCRNESNPFSCYAYKSLFIVQFNVHDCGHNMTLLRGSPNDTIAVDRLLSATPPVTGSFDVHFEGTIIKNIRADYNATQLKALLDRYLPNEGPFEVSQSGNCARPSWSISWTERGGDRPLMRTNGRNLIGSNVSVLVLPIVDGGVWMRPLRADMLRAPHIEPQVQVTINNIPSSCSSENCSITFTNDSISSLFSVHPTTGNQDSSPITISGADFPSYSTDVTVTIGTQSCDIQSMNSTTIVCIPVPGVAGVYDVNVLLGDIGYALANNVTFQYLLRVDSVQPNEGSIGGSNLVNLSGLGFPEPEDNSSLLSETFYVLFGEYPCLPVSSNLTSLSCLTQAHKPGSVNITVLINGVTTIIPNGYLYSKASTARIHMVVPNSSPANGGVMLLILAMGLVAADDLIVSTGKTDFTLISVSSTQMSCYTNPTSPGLYDIAITSNSTFGRAIPNSLLDQPDEIIKNSKTLLELLNDDLLANHMNTITIPFTFVFDVLSIAPSYGSLFGGTKLTITGSGFVGNVTVVDEKGDPFCRKMSYNDTEINCTTTSVRKRHVIENNGTDPILGPYFAWSPSVLTISVGDRVTWQWTGSVLINPREFEVHQNEPGGFKSPSSINGNFTITFTETGIFNYSTDVSDVCLACFMTGSIIVRPLESIAKSFRVVLNDSGIGALYNLTGDETSQAMNDSCHVEYSMKNDDAPVFVYSVCETPIIYSIDTENATVYSNITINGTGLAGDGVRAHFGPHKCDISYNDDDLIVCQLNSSSQPRPFVSLPLKLHVDNKGYAAINADMKESSALKINPIITSIVPNSGSVLGNTVTISGASFLNASHLRVYLGNRRCRIRSILYNAIKVVVPSLNGTSNNLTNITESFNITFGPTKEALCGIEGGCTYQYTKEKTPIIQSVHPVNLSITDVTVITITGKLLSNRSIVIIGRSHCLNVTLVDSGTITCIIFPMEANDYNIRVFVREYGYAEFVNDTIITSPLMIRSVSPDKGSKRGGTLVTISGFGFSTKSTGNYVSLNNKKCVIVTSNYTTIQCVTPDLNQEGTFDLVVSIIGSTSQGTKRSKRSVQASVAFQYNSSSTPSVISISPPSGQAGDIVVIDGQLLSSNASVSIGGIPCNITSGSDTAISCILGPNFVGDYNVEVSVPSLGSADGALSFHYDLEVDSLSPNEGSFAGYNTLTLSGVGFDPTATFITICNESCFYSNDQPTLNSISCIVPSLSHLLLESVNTLNCSVLITSASSTAMTYYTLKRDLTPIVISINRTRGGTAGGSLVYINGTGFTGSGSINVSIAETKCSVREYTDTYIVCETGASGYTVKASVMVYVEGKGFAVSNSEFYYVDLWSSPYTWGGGPLPIEGDFVIVPSGQRLVLDIRTPVLKIVLIQGGELIFDDESNGIELHSENILITDGGKLEVGTEESYYKHKAQIVMYGHRLSTELPLFGAKTLAVRNGTLDLHGKPIRDTWTCITKTVRPGDNLLTLKHNVSDWEIGGKVIITSTSYSQRENEELVIEGISSDGHSITVSPPLNYTHISLVQVIHGKTIETCAEVGYLTRNVVVRGNRNEEWDVEFGSCDEEFKPGQFEVQTCFGGRFGREAIGDEFGSQIMLHKGPRDTIIGRIEYVEVTHAGQAFRLGRYPIHFHLNGNVSGSYVRGCGIHNTFNRAVTIHAVDYLLVEKNVAYNIKGHAYFLEDGIEIGNIIQYNLAVFVKASSSLLNVDITPASFWSVNPDNTFRHNAAAGGTHFGFWYRLPQNPTGPSFTTSVEPVHAPMGPFYNNTAHSFGWYGIWIFASYYPERASTCREVTPAVFEQFLAWRNVRGVEFSEVGAVQLKHSIMLDNTIAGVEYTHVESAWGKNGALIEDVLIIAHSQLRDVDHAGLVDGVEVCTGAGIKTPPSNYLTVSNITFVNFNESGCYALRACSHCRNKQGGFETRFEKLVFDASPNVAFWKWEHEQVFRDMDGTLTGIRGGALLPTSNALPSNHCQNHPNSSFGLVPGSVCDQTVSFVRFALINPRPSSLKYRDLNLTSPYGRTTLGFVKKRLVFGPGYMAILPTKVIYKLAWAGGERFTNLSYASFYSALNYTDYLWIEHNFSQSVDIANINSEMRTMSPALPAPGVSVLGDWYAEENETLLTYYVNGSNPFCLSDVKVTFSSYHCFYENCIVPTPPPPINITIGRPNTTYTWSNSSIWPNGALPLNGSDVYIPCSLYVLVDVPLPFINRLNVCGGLEFMDDMDHVLETNLILIDGGQLVAGSEDSPFMHQLIIVLHGSLSSPVYRLPNFGPVLGAKALGVFGYLGLHGQERLILWTHLAKAARAGDRTLVLKTPVDWLPGEEIVIASTSFEASQAEELTITSVSNDRLTVTIDPPLAYNHIGGSSTGNGDCPHACSAEVGLLSRNIKILGVHPNSSQHTSDVESYGCRVLVSGYFNSTLGQQFIGSAKISGVEFKGCGQEGFYDEYDPRYSLAFLGIGPVINDGSYVKNCSFHKGYSTGIGVIDTHDMTISNNVLHRTVGPSLYVSGSGHEIINNLAVVAVFPGTYRIPNEPFNPEWTANYELSKASDIVLIGNAAGGGAKAGYHTNGEKCNTVPIWRDNVAHSTLHGIHMGYEDGQTHCSSFYKFKVYSCYHYGFFSYSKSGILISGSLFINNYAAVFAVVMGPTSLSHQVGNKSVTIQDTCIVSTFDHVNCTEYSYKPIIAYHHTSHSGIQSATAAHVGVIIPSFVSGQGHFPKFAWKSISTYPAINGHTQLINVLFYNFSTHCAGRTEAAIITQQLSEDCQHPLSLKETLFSFGSNTSKLYIHRPQLGSINPSDCVDMDCDGLKKILIRDTDGAFLGRQGLSTVISKSEYEWDGDSRRGLGDYRIPYAMLGLASGNKIDPDVLYPNKGIYRGDDGDCQWHSDWNGYLCTGIDHMMLAIESLDADTEVRRLSPVGVGSSGYIDLINGPQDQGWCGGYTCQERISTFYAIVSTGINYTIGLTSTNPQKTNFILLNASDSQSLLIAYIYNNPQRLDVYIENTYVIPTNGYMLNGDLRYSGQGSSFIPSLTDPSGSNYYDRGEKKLYIVVKGDSPVTVITTMVMQLGLHAPPLTVDQFFEENLVQNLALLFNIPQSRIRIVNVVSEGGTRRKRQTGTGTLINIEIGNSPMNKTINVTSTGPTPDDNMTYNSLLSISESVGISVQTGQLSMSLGITIYSADVTEPIPVVVDPTGGNRATNGTGGPQPGDPGTANLTTFAEKQLEEEQMRENTSQSVTLLIPNRLAVISMPTSGTEGVPLDPIEVVMYDTSGSIIPTLGVASFPWILTAFIVTPNSNTFLINNSTSIGNGQALFNDLIFSHQGSYEIGFNITYPSIVSYTATSSSSTSIGRRSLYLNVATQPPSIANTTFPLPHNLSVQVLDLSINTVAVSLGWRGRDWFMSASIVSQTKGTVEQVLPDARITKGVATFSGIHIHSAGSYVIRFTTSTEPQSPSQELPPSLDSRVITVHNYPLTRYIITYSNQYSLLSGREAEFIQELIARVQAFSSSVFVYNGTVREGSIRAGLFVTSTELGALHDFNNNIRSLSSLSFTFNNQALHLVSVVQDPDYPIPPLPTEATEPSSPVLILAIVMSLLGIIVIIGLIVGLIAACVCHHFSKRNISPTNRIRVKPAFINYEIYSNQSNTDEMNYTGTELRLLSAASSKTSGPECDHRPSVSSTARERSPLSHDVVPSHPHSAGRRMY